MRRTWAWAALLALVSALWALPAQAQFRGREPNLKIGLNRVMVSGANYEVDGVGDTSEPFVGNDLFIEYVFFGRIGVELAYSLTPYTRTSDLDTGLSDTESVTSALAGANLYFGRNRTRGFNFFFGLATGTYSSKHEFDGGALDGQTASQTVPVNVMKLGVDWIMEQAGLRLQYGVVSGKLTESEDLGVAQTLDYNASLLTVGVLAFF